MSLSENRKCGQTVNLDDFSSEPVSGIDSEDCFFDRHPNVWEQSDFSYHNDARIRMILLSVWFSKCLSHENFYRGLLYTEQASAKRAFHADMYSTVSRTAHNALNLFTKLCQVLYTTTQGVFLLYTATCQCVSHSRCYRCGSRHYAGLVVCMELLLNQTTLDIERNAEEVRKKKHF